MRILITGGLGQLGRALNTVLKGEHVAAPGHTELDVTDPQQVREAGEAPGLVAEACRQSGAAMVYISSNEVFDGEKAAPYVEDDSPNPINSYARSKFEGELRVRAALERYSVVRTSWLYGPGRISFPEKILRAAKEHGTLRLVTDEVASPTWALDLAKAISSLIRHEAQGIFHLTNAGYCSRKEWAEGVLRLADENVSVEPTTQSEFGAPFRKPQFSALANVNAKALGIAMRPWQEALAEHLQQATLTQGTRS